MRLSYFIHQAVRRPNKHVNVALKQADLSKLASGTGTQSFIEALAVNRANVRDASCRNIKDLSPSAAKPREPGAGHTSTSSNITGQESTS